MTEQTSIGANDGIIVTTVGAAPSSGPFSIDFPFDNLDDVIVTTTDSLGVQTILTRGLDYAIAATANGDGLYPSGVVTLVLPVANVALARWRSTPLERSSQLPLTGYLDRAALNSDLNRMMMAMQDFERRYGRYIRLPDDDPAVDAVVPAKSVRAGKTFIWDANGEPDAGELVALNVVLNDFWRLSVLPTANAPAARTALGAAGLTSANAFTAANSFAALTTFTAGATFSSLSPTTVSPGAAADDSTRIPNTAWVQDAMDLRLAGTSDLTTVPTIVELTSGSGTWTVPAGVKWFDVEMVGGGGGGSGLPGELGNDGIPTSFDGYMVAGGFKGAGAAVSGEGGAGGLGGTGGTTGSGTAAKVIRRDGNPGHAGANFSQVTAEAGFSGAGGQGGAGLLGGAPGQGGGGGGGGGNTAGAVNSGSGGGGAAGSGGGGAGEYAFLRYAAVAASYAYAVGAGAAASGARSAGGSGYIRIRCHFNY